jgi:hypothetical protein
MFDEIKITNSPYDKTEVDGYTCVFTHANANPAAHYWDLFVDNESLDFFKKNYKIKQYHMGGLVSGDLPEYKPHVISKIKDIYNEFIKTNNIVEFSSIHYRTQDLQEELEFLEKNKLKINEIVNSGENIFICSNSSEFKKYVKSLNNKNVFYWELPMEDVMGGNHLDQYHLDNETLHQRCFYTLLDMWTLGKSKKIHAFTTWGRHSNFLVYGAINKSEIFLHG